MIRDKIAKLKIPKNTPYCYTPKKPLKGNIGYKVKPCPYIKYKYNVEYGEKMEYCTYLKEFLSIQDMVKDCGINDEYEGERKE